MAEHSMAEQWKADGTFHLGINMSGAVSAGAYTAGVLDFLMEALEQWYSAKSQPNPAVPLHDISLDVFSGASAGGMCAAIASVMVQGTFDHIRNPADPTVRGTNNVFFESWVNKVDIEPLLQSNDLAAGGPVVSFLDSSIIDQIADYAITPGTAAARPYISKSLTLYLTLTNVRGTPFSLNGTATGSAEEDIAYYADQLQFETVEGSAAPLSPLAKPLPIGSSAGAWPLLKEAAKATGAFPLFLAPRKLERSAGDYLNSPWEPVSVENPVAVPPHWPLKPSDVLTTLNVDGGATDNDPFELSHDYLAIHNPLATVDPSTGDLMNPRAADQANCAVLTVAPFPAMNLFDPNFDADKNSGVFAMLPNLFTALVGQSRFLGESLTAVLGGASFSRFVMAPSDTTKPNGQALQCGALGAFGGFCERGFRAHDYQLGRRNCQKFLRDHFLLSADNPIIQAGLKGFDPVKRDAVIAAFDPSQSGFLPIIPLCGSAVPEVTAPAQATITSARVGQIVNWAVNRLHAVTKVLLSDAVMGELDRFAARSAADALISTWGKARIRAYLQDGLKDVISG